MSRKHICNECIEEKKYATIEWNDSFWLFSPFIRRTEKEKSKFQAEVYELLAQVESVTKEKILSIKQVEKLEITINELSIKIEELNRTIVDITSHKTRLSQENVELIKDVQDLKLNFESVSYSRQQIASQLEDARRRLEDDERRRATLEASLHQVEIELESVRVQLEEEAEARLDLERQLVKSNGKNGFCYLLFAVPRMNHNFIINWIAGVHFALFHSRGPTMAC